MTTREGRTPVTRNSCMLQRTSNLQNGHQRQFVSRPSIPFNPIPSGKQTLGIQSPTVALSQERSLVGGSRVTDQPAIADTVAAVECLYYYTYVVT